MGQILQVDDVLLEKRLVEPFRVANAGQSVGIAVLAHRHADGVAGAEAGDGEGNERHRQQNDGRPEEPSDYVR